MPMKLKKGDRVTIKGSFRVLDVDYGTMINTVTIRVTYSGMGVRVHDEFELPMRRVQKVPKKSAKVK